MALGSWWRRDEFSHPLSFKIGSIFGHFSCRLADWHWIVEACDMLWLAQNVPSIYANVVCNKWFGTSLYDSCWWLLLVDVFLVCYSCRHFLVVLMVWHSLAHRQVVESLSVWISFPSSQLHSISFICPYKFKEQ